MKYLFLNQFAFENINSRCSEQHILDTIENIVFLIRDLNILNSELILDSKISEFNFRGKKLYYYFRLILDDDNKDSDVVKLLLSRIQTKLPFCSDSFDGYFEDENIVLGDCIVKDTTIDILENFLACALFLDSPIVTPKTICQNSCFLDESIIIDCRSNSSFKELKNYSLEDREIILNEIEISLKENINSWQEWKNTILPNYQNIDMTEYCFKEIQIYSFSSDISKSILNFIEKINKFVQDKTVTNINYKECYSNTKPESDGRLKSLKNKLAIYNCNYEKEIANWHTWIKKDFRLYFTFDVENNKICFVKFTKKIT